MSNINSEQFTSHINNFILQVLLFVQKAVKIIYYCFKTSSHHNYMFDSKHLLKLHRDIWCIDVVTLRCTQRCWRAGEK